MSTPRPKVSASPAFVLTIALIWSLASVLMTVRAVSVLRDPDAGDRVLPVLIAVLFVANAVIWGVKYWRRRRQDAALDR